MKKHVHSLARTMCLALILCTAFAVPAKASYAGPYLFIHDGTQYCDVRLDEDGSGNGWSYDASESTLTLNGFYGAYIYCTCVESDRVSDTFTVVLNGDNVVTGSGEDARIQ